MPVTDQTPDVILYDANGVEMAVANGVAIPVGTRGLIAAGSDGSAARFLKTDTTGQLYVITGAVAELGTWSAFAGSVAIGNNKSMISILNATGTAVVVKLREIWVENVQTAPVTGLVGTFDVRRMTGHSVGTAITPQAYDTTDTLDANVTVRTGATIAGETATPLLRHYWSTDEWGPGTLDEEGYEHGIQASNPFWSRKDLAEKPITLQSGQGITVKFTVNSVAGTFDLTLVFTQG